MNVCIVTSKGIFLRGLLLSPLRAPFVMIKRTKINQKIRRSSYPLGVVGNVDFAFGLCMCEIMIGTTRSEKENFI